MTDCIHGLEIAMCDVCTPRAVPDALASASPARRPRASTSRGSLRQPRASAARAESTPAAAVAVRGAAQRRYLVVEIEGLGDEFATAEESDWSGLVPAGIGKDRVIVVAAEGAADAQFIAVANEPARRTARESLRAAGVEVRVIVQPEWFG